VKTFFGGFFIVSIAVVIGGMITFHYLDYTVAEGKIINSPKEKTPTTIQQIPSDKLLEQTLEIEDMTTNLLDGKFMLSSYTIVLSNSKTKEELNQKVFQLNDYLIKELSETPSHNIKTKEGVDQFLEKFESYVNGQLTKGQVVEIYLTKKVVK